MLKKKLFLLIFLIFLVPTVFAGEIVGNKIVENIAGKAIIEVTPHTAFSPIGMYNQEFSLAPIIDVNDMRAVYLFKEKPGVSKSYIKKWVEPVYEINRYVVGDWNVNVYDWNYSVTAREINPWDVMIWQTRDVNGTDTNVVVWQGQVSDSNFALDPPIRRFYYDKNEVVSGNTWVDVKNKWHSLGQVDVGGVLYYYYYSDEFNIKAGKNYTWELGYNVTSSSGEWDLYFVKGSGDCLQLDNCSESWHVDPWWNGLWNSKHRFVVDSSGIANDYEFLLDLNVDNASHMMANSRSDFFDIRILNCAEDTVIPHWRSMSTADTNAHIWTDINAVAGENCGWVYYDNPVAPDTSDFNTVFDFATQKFDDFSDNDYTNDPTWIVGNGGWTAASGFLTEDDLQGNHIRAPLSNYVLNNNSVLAQFVLNVVSVGASSAIWPFTRNVSSFCNGGDGVQIESDTGNILVEGSLALSVGQIEDADKKITIYKNESNQVFAIVDNTFFGASIAQDFTGEFNQTCYSANSGVSQDATFDNILYSDSTLTDVNVLFDAFHIPQDANVLFNIYASHNVGVDLTNFDIDFNVNFYDQIGVDSPFNVLDVNSGHYLVTISKTGFDSNSNNFVNVDSNQNLTFELRENIAPITTSDANSNIWQNTNANVTLTCNDGSGSGCSSIQYSLSLDDFEDNWELWLEGDGDGDNPISETTIKKEGASSIHLGTDASLGNDFSAWHRPWFADIDSSPIVFDLSSFTGVDSGQPTKGVIKVWIYFDTLDYLSSGTSDQTVNFYISSLGADSYWAFLGKDKLTAGEWYLWEMDLTLNDANHGIDGTIDWTSIRYFMIQNFSVGGNTNDYEMYLDDLRIESSTSGSTANIVFTADGNFVFDFNSTDNAGNIEDTNRQFVLIDKTDPTTTSNINSGVAQPDDANVVLTCVDPISGCSLTQYRLDSDSSDNVSFGAWTTFTTGIEITIDGNFAVDFNSSDVAGNLETTNTQYVIIAHTIPEPPGGGGGGGDPPQPPPEEFPSFAILEPEGDFTLFYVLTFPIHQKFKLQNLTDRDLTINMSNDLPNSAYHTIYSDWDGILDANSTKEFYISFLFNRSINTNKIQIIFSDNTPGETLVLTSTGFFTPADELPGTVLVSALEFLKIDFLRSLVNFDLGGGFVLGWVLMSLLAVLFFSSLYMASGKTRVILLLILFVLFVLLLINFFVFPQNAG